MTKVVKITSALLILMLVFAAVLPVLAVDPTTIKSNTSGTAAGTVKDVSGQIIGIVQIVGTVIAIIMLIVLAIKYLIASPQEKGDIKKGAIIYVVAAVILFAAVNILGMIRDWALDLKL